MIRIYEAGLAIIMVLVVLAQVFMLSAGRLGEQWDCTGLDVEVKKALGSYQTGLDPKDFSRYSKIGDPEFLRVPDSESMGFDLLVNGESITDAAPPGEVEIVASDARVQYPSRDAARISRSLWRKLLRSEYIPQVGQSLDYDTIDELADLVLGIIWDEESHEMLERRISTVIENQNDDGGWGFVRDEESDALCTSLATQALSAWISKGEEDPLSDSTVVGGISWLKDRVHADGGYGARERLESCIDMTAQALLAFHQAGLGGGDPHVAAGLNFILRHQNPDGGFPRRPKSGSDVSTTAVAVEALIELEAPQAMVEDALLYLEREMIDDGNFNLTMDSLGYSGAYDLNIDTGYIVDCSIRGYEFWGRTADESMVLIVDVYGTRENMTVVLRIERGRLVLPTNKQKIALAFSHNTTPDTLDWWILNAGNPHTAGQGDPIDDPKFRQEIDEPYTYVTITNLVVPDEYEFFAPKEDWLIAIVGDESHPIKDNPGRGYLIGYWDAWMPALPYGSILAWRSLGSPVANRACLDTDEDFEFDDMRLAHLDTASILGQTWEIEMKWDVDNSDLDYIRYRQIDTNMTRTYEPLRYDLSSIPESASGLYRFGIISFQNKPSFSRNYMVILRESREEGDYDEAYIHNGTHWDLFLEGSTWTKNGTAWVVDIEGDFLTLTRKNSLSAPGLSGDSTMTLSVEGDFITIDLIPIGLREVWVTLLDDTGEVDRTIFTRGYEESFRIIFGTWGVLRETSKVYHALALAETRVLDEDAFLLAHSIADLSQQAIKFGKEYNSVVEDLISLGAWHRFGS